MWNPKFRPSVIVCVQPKTTRIVNKQSTQVLCCALVSPSSQPNLPTAATERTNVRRGPKFLPQVAISSRWLRWVLSKKNRVPGSNVVTSGDWWHMFFQSTTSSRSKEKHSYQVLPAQTTDGCGTTSACTFTFSAKTHTTEKYQGNLLAGALSQAQDSRGPFCRDAAARLCQLCTSYRKHRGVSFGHSKTPPVHRGPMRRVGVCRHALHQWAFEMVPHSELVQWANRAAKANGGMCLCGSRTLQHPRHLAKSSLVELPMFSCTRRRAIFYLKKS